MKKVKYILAGFLAALVILPGAFVFAKSLDVELNSVRIEKDKRVITEIGESYALPNGDLVPFSLLYNGTTYLPVRKLSEILSVGIGWDNDTRTVSITSKEQSSVSAVENAYSEYPEIYDFGKIADTPCILTSYTLRSTIFWYKKEAFTKENTDAYCAKLLLSGFTDKSSVFSGNIRYFEKGDLGITVSGCPDSHLMDYIVVSNLKRPYQEKKLFYDASSTVPSFEGFCKISENKTKLPTGAIYKYTELLNTWNYFADYAACLADSGFVLKEKRDGLLGPTYLFKSGKTSLYISAASVSGTGDTCEIQYTR